MSQLSDIVSPLGRPVVDADIDNALSSDEETIDAGFAAPPPSEVDPDAEAIVEDLTRLADPNAFGDGDRHSYYLISLFADESKGGIPQNAMHPREILGSDTFDKASRSGCLVFCEEISSNGAHHCHLFYHGPRITRVKIKNTAVDNGYLVASQELHEILPIQINRGPLSKKSKYQIALAIRYCSEGYKSKKTQLDGFHYLKYGKFNNEDPVTWAVRYINDYNKEAERIKERIEKQRKKNEGIPSMNVDDALEYVEPFLPVLQLWMTVPYVFKCLVITAKNDPVLRRCLDKHKTKVRDLIQNRLNEIEPPNRLNEGIIMFCGAARTGKSTSARNYCKDRWGTLPEFAGAPLTALYHAETWSGVNRGFWEYNNAPGFIVDEAESHSCSLSVFKKCYDKGNWGGNHYFGLELKGGSTIHANHSVAILTSNVPPTRLYHNLFAEDEEHWHAVRDRMSACFWSPRFRIKDGLDFSNLEEGPDGEKVRNIVEMDATGKLTRDAQRIDVMPVIKSMNFTEANCYFEQIKGQGLSETPYTGSLRLDNPPANKRFKYALQGDPEPGHRSW